MDPVLAGIGGVVKRALGAAHPNFKSIGGEGSKSRLTGDRDGVPRSARVKRALQRSVRTESPAWKQPNRGHAFVHRHAGHCHRSARLCGPGSACRQSPCRRCQGIFGAAGHSFGFGPVQGVGGERQLRDASFCGLRRCRCGGAWSIRYGRRGSSSFLCCGKLSERFLVAWLNRPWNHTKVCLGLGRLSDSCRWQGADVRRRLNLLENIWRPGPEITMEGDRGAHHHHTRRQRTPPQDRPSQPYRTNRGNRSHFTAWERQGQHLAAIMTLRKMPKHLIPFALAQRFLRECGDHIRIRMCCARRRPQALRDDFG